MTRAILVNFHLYTPFGKEFYEPILDYFLKMIEKYKEEYDTLYLLDSNWEIDPEKIKNLNVKIIRTNPSLRYYDAYKEVLPQVKEDLVLFMDNDFIIYKPQRIHETFLRISIPHYEEDNKPLNPYDVVSIIDTIGKYGTSKLKSGNKFCPYWFATRKELLMKYLDVEWGPNMPYYETLGGLTEEMLNDDVKVYELEDDKSGIYLGDAGGILSEGEKGKNLGYYHIRAGSTPAYLLATKKYGNKKTYEDYIENQPKQEYLRQMAWYWYMNLVRKDFNKDIEAAFTGFLRDVEIDLEMWANYIKSFENYHGLNLKEDLKYNLQ